ncbi:hypothetical protein OSTOST_22122, partial [Ostertagia ostertagi]
VPSDGDEEVYEDCPEAIKEYWIQHEARKSKEHSSSKKRDHSDRHSVQSSSSRRSTSPPTAKRRLIDGFDLEGMQFLANSSADSGSASPTISECLGEATSQKDDTNTESFRYLQSAEVMKAKRKSSSVEPNVQLDDVPRESNTAGPQTVPNVPSTPFKDQLQSSDVSARSSPCLLPQQPVRKTIPLPPALPKRKRVQSTSTTSSSLPSTNVPDAEQSATSVSKQSDSDQRKTASPSISSEQDVKKGSEAREIQAKPVKKIEVCLPG